MFTVFLKEMRQCRRDRAAIGALVAQVALSLLVLAVRASAGSALAESPVFGSGPIQLFGTITASVIAAAMAQRWSRELNSDSLNPARTTPIPAPQLTAGKFLATFAATLVPLAITLLFLPLCESLPASFWRDQLPLTILAWGIGVSAMLVVASMRFSANTGGSILIVLPLVLIISVTAALPHGGTARLEIFCCFVSGAFAILLAFAMMTAMLSAPRSDRAFPIRIVLTAAAAILPWILALPSYRKYGTFSLPSTMNLVACLAAPIAFFTVFAAALERRHQSRRVEKEIARLPALLRPLRRLFSTGVFPELSFSLLMMLTALAAHGDWSRNRLCGMLGPYAVFVFYTAAAVFILRLNDRRWHRRLPPWGIWLLIFSVCNVPPGVTGKWGWEHLSFLSPFRSVMNLEYPPLAIAAVTAAALLFLAPVAADSFRALRRQGRRADADRAERGEERR